MKNRVKTYRSYGLGLFFLVAAGLLAAAFADEKSGGGKPNQLTAAEKKAGWRLLFDGKTTNGWRGFNKKEFPTPRWIVDGDTLHCVGKTGQDSHGGGDIVTTEQFTDFDLTFEWRIAPGGNSGVKYFIVEERKAPIGHEYQLIDDDKHPDAKIGAKRTTASFYDVLPPKNKTLRPVGEFNKSRILVHGTHVEHWLNGAKVLDYTLGSDEVKAAIAASKFKNVPGFGNRVKGPILLQDHGDEIWFRNIKIRELTAE